MNKTILTFCFLLSGNTSLAQENVFEWQNEAIIAKSKFTPLVQEPTPLPEGIRTYVIKRIELRSPNQNHKYILQLNEYNEVKQEDELLSYQSFTLSYNNRILVDYIPSNCMHTVTYQTMDQNKSYYQVIPLEDDAFALMLGGWFYGYDKAPEMIIIVINGDKAKVVFDNYAYAYKYQAPPAFSMEFVDDVDWFQDEHVEVGESWIPNAAALSVRTKHKIWKEGNVLKYKSWK